MYVYIYIYTQITYREVLSPKLFLGIGASKTILMKACLSQGPSSTEESLFHGQRIRKGLV